MNLIKPKGTITYTVQILHRGQVAYKKAENRGAKNDARGRCPRDLGTYFYNQSAML